MVSKQTKPNFLKPEYSDSTALKSLCTADEQENFFIFNAHHSLSIDDQRERLPIRKYRDQILYCLEKHQILILIGETGSGKSTQVPQYLYEWGWHAKGLIAVIEPRRVCTVTLANRVAQERGESVGDSVGLAIRFMERSSKNTAIKFMTEGIFLRELLADPLLMQYSAIIIDEVHERNLLTDTILGLIKKIIKKRDTLKIIISSATIDADFFRQYFDNKHDASKSCALLSVDGRTHPIDIFYLNKACANYVRETVETVWKIHKMEPTGDILAFLTGQDEVLEALDLLREYINDDGCENIRVFPMYSTLGSKDQLKVFYTPPKGIRKVVLATNVAETSITIPGVVYVIDSGFVKLKWFDADKNADTLVIVPTSKATAKQRAGRAGRTRPGKVYRLYTKDDFEKLPERIPPEMRRTELTSVVLDLKSFGIRNILRFDFPAAPPAKNLLASLEILYALNAIDDKANLTKPVGYILAEMPLSPMLAKMLYLSGQMGCSAEILSIVAMLQVQSVFSKPVSAQGQAKARIAKRYFEVAEGDLITLLNVYTAYVASDQTKEFCGRYYLIYRNLKLAVELREQMATLARKKFNIPLNSCGGDTDVICRCITAACFLNAAYLHHSGAYRQIRSDLELSIHPNSTLYTLTQPQYIIYCELLQTTKLFMNNLTVIKGEWLNELATHYYYKTTVRD